MRNEQLGKKLQLNKLRNQEKRELTVKEEEIKKNEKAK